MKIKRSDLAKNFAKKKHKGKYRRFEDKPYITHPIAVADKLKTLNQSDDVISAAYLHDVLENTDTYAVDIEQLFGHDIADLVKQVTAPDGYNGKKKSQFWQDKTMEMSDDALLIKLVDRLHNTRSIVATLKKVLSFKDFTIRQTKEIINNLLRNNKNLTKEQKQIILEFAQISGLKWNKNGLLTEQRDG